MLDKSNIYNKVEQLLVATDRDIKREFFNSEIGQEPCRYDDDNIVEFKQELANAGIKFEHVDNYGGEDQGSDYWSVYSFTDGMQVVFIKFDGWYASYEGSTCEEFYEVKPVEKTITVFEKK
jgi:hypothetical protein